MSVKAVAVSAALTVGLLVPVSAAMAADGAPATAAAKTPSIAKQLKSLKTQVKKNTATGKANTAKIKAASKAVATTVAGLNAKADAINKRVDAGDMATSDLDGKVNAVIATATDALTKLQAGLVQVGDGLKSLGASYTNFEYGVVQLYATDGTTSTPIAGAFLATPRLDPTVEQATVTGQFACGVAQCATQKAQLKVAVRSANPTANDATSKVYCRVTASQQTGATSRFTTSISNPAFPGATPGSEPPAYAVPRSALVPTSAADLAAFPLSMVGTDTTVDLTTTTKSTGTSGPGGFALQPSNGTLGGLVNVTLSCLTVPNPAT